jgi:Hg(II)-responsive transcriptional regulator
VGGYTIGALASACGVGRDTIRYYERSGLMPRPDRTASGYRIYDKGDVDRVNFIKTAQSLGFTLNEIGLLLSLRGSDTASAADVVKLTESKIRSVATKLRQLKAIKQALEQLVADCPVDVPASDCPILIYISHASHKRLDRRNGYNQAR